METTSLETSTCAAQHRPQGGMPLVLTLATEAGVVIPVHKEVQPIKRCQRHVPVVISDAMDTNAAHKRFYELNTATAVGRAAIREAMSCRWASTDMHADE